MLIRCLRQRRFVASDDVQILSNATKFISSDIGIKERTFLKLARGVMKVIFQNHDIRNMRVAILATLKTAQVCTRPSCQAKEKEQIVMNMGMR